MIRIPCPSLTPAEWLGPPGTVWETKRRMNYKCFGIYQMARVVILTTPDSVGTLRVWSGPKRSWPGCQHPWARRGESYAERVMAYLTAFGFVRVGWIPLPEVV